jgi:hypothetical protein
MKTIFFLNFSWIFKIKFRMQTIFNLNHNYTVSDISINMFLFKNSMWNGQIIFFNHKWQLHYKHYDHYTHLYTKASNVFRIRSHGKHFLMTSKSPIICLEKHRTFSAFVHIKLKEEFKEINNLTDSDCDRWSLYNSVFFSFTAMTTIGIGLNL